MNDTMILAAVKIDLGISSSAYDVRLGQYIQSSKAALTDEGITLSVSQDGDVEMMAVEDANLVAMYAAWLWRRRNTGEGMPRALRWLINNRLFRGKVASNG